MKFNKLLALILVFIVIGLVIYYYFFVPTVYFNIDTTKIEISSYTVSVPVQLHSLKDAVYKIYLSSKHGTKEVNKEQQNFVLLLKKGQKYSFNFPINCVVETDKIQHIVTTIAVEEIITGRKKSVKKIVLQLPKEKSVTKEEIQPVVVQKEIPKTVVEEVQIKIKEKPDFDIVLSTETFKEEYHYNEIVKFVFLLKNKTTSVELNPKVDIMLKDKQELVLSSKTITSVIKPQQVKEYPVEIDVSTNLPQGEYYIELNAKIDTVQKVVKSVPFKIIDLPPKIVLAETPVIKYKLTNTILIEVEDDKEVTDIKLVEIDEKKNVETEHKMLLIAGDKKIGLYSYTTEKVLRKDFYKFYIKAYDVAGNMSKTEVYTVKITK